MGAGSIRPPMRSPPARLVAHYVAARATDTSAQGHEVGHNKGQAARTTTAAILPARASSPPEDARSRSTRARAKLPRTLPCVVGIQDNGESHHPLGSSEEYSDHYGRS